MKTLTYNLESQKWIESNDGLDPEVISNDWHMEVLRKQRNLLLKETDFYALSDVTMSNEMKTYRQALRDLPANTSDAANPTFPVKPS